MSKPAHIEQFDEAQLLQWLWKTEAMRRMAVEFVKLAMARDEFSADDLPANFEHGGTGVAGSILARLAQNRIIERVGFWQGQQFFPKLHVSRREGRKAAKVGVYRVRDAVKARAFLKANHKVSEPFQPDLIPA